MNHDFGSLDRRLATEEDAAFLLHLYHCNRAAELMMFGFSAEHQLQFVQMQFRARAFHYAHAYPGAQDQILQLNQQNVGRLLLHSSASTITLLDIGLLPEYCGRGIGSQVLTELIADADRGSKAIELHVEPQSRAKKLYQRLGFLVTQELPPYEAMVREPATGPTARDG